MNEHTLYLQVVLYDKIQCHRLLWALFESILFSFAWRRKRNIATIFSLDKETFNNNEVFNAILGSDYPNITLKRERERERERERPIIQYSC